MKQGLLEGRVCLVTGGSRGIGAEIALHLAQNGATVAVNYLKDKHSALEIVQKIRRIGQKSQAFAADVADPKQVEKMLDDISGEFGQVDILVNNAGIHRGGRIHLISPKEFESVVDTAIMGAFYCSRMVIPSMIEQRWGRIVNITSVMGLRGWPGDTAYSAAKAGLIGFTKALAKEIAGDGILVNAVAPGYITTEMTSAISERGRQKMLEVTPMKRPGSAKEVAETVVFLVSEGTYTTGTVISVDGGMGS